MTSITCLNNVVVTVSFFFPPYSSRQFFEHLGRVDPTVSVPGDFVMVGRCVILLRGLCHILNRPGVSIAKEWEAFARKTIKREQSRSHCNDATTTI